MMGRPEVQAGSVTSPARRKMSKPVAKSTGFTLWSLALVMMSQLPSVKGSNPTTCPSKSGTSDAYLDSYTSPCIVLSTGTYAHGATKYSYFDAAVQKNCYLKKVGE
jgi:hypothetical protein